MTAANPTALSNTKVIPGERAKRTRLWNYSAMRMKDKSVQISAQLHGFRALLARVAPPGRHSGLAPRERMG